MSATPIQADARCLPLADASVDLIITSPPYFALRSYRDGGDHYDGQVGSEPTPQAFLEALWEVSKECWRVLKPTGSYFVNLGDKRSGSGGHNNAGISAKSTLRGNGHVGGVGKAGPQKIKATLRNAPDRYNQAAFGRPKSKMLLPHRFAIGCEDGLADPDGIGWIVRSDMVWNKPNGLPESVTDRVRDSHEYWFMLNKQGRYFSAVDEVREAQQSLGKGRPWSTDVDGSVPTWGIDGTQGLAGKRTTDQMNALNPLGKLPGSVWTIASEPLTIPEAVKAHYNLPDHFAAFPQEWPRRLILGWSPSGVCVECGEGRRPVVDKEYRSIGDTFKGGTATEGRHRSGTRMGDGIDATITGYACACHCSHCVRGTCPNEYHDETWVPPPTKPAVVIDPFGGTGTVAGVARQLGRLGISFDLSHDYSRLAQWFLRDGRRFAKTSTRTDRERQGVLL